MVLNASRVCIALNCTLRFVFVEMLNCCCETSLQVVGKYVFMRDVCLTRWHSSNFEYSF